MKSVNLALAISLIGLFATVLGCEAENTPSQNGAPLGGSGNGAVAGSGGGDAPALPPDTACAVPNSTRMCSCDRNGEPVSGRQTCLAGTGWTACECAELLAEDADGGTSIHTGPEIDPLQNKIMKSFDWYHAMSGIGSCEAGHYEGAFAGDYNPALVVVFSAGFSGSMPVSGNVSHDIMEDETGEYFEVRDGVFEGMAMAMFPFQGEFYGKLDCTTVTFEGGLRNCFYIAFGLQFAFEGLARSRYDKNTHSFIDGVWSVTELDANGVHPPPPEAYPGQPLPPPPQLGGIGTWETTWVP